MSLETDLYGILSTNANLLSLLGNNYVYLGMIPKGQPDSPAVVVQTVFTTPLTGADGPNRLMKKRVQIDSYHEQYPQAVAISNAVRDIVKVLTGDLTSTSIDGTILVTDKDMPDEPGQSGYVFRRMLEVDVWHTEST